MALRDVNLIPPDVMVHRLMMRHVACWLAGLIACTALIFGIYIGETRMIRGDQKSLVQMKNVQAQLAARIEVQKRLQTDQDRLNQQKATLYSIRLKSRQISPVIATLSEIMNDQTWLTRVTIESRDEKESGVRLVLNGSSTSNEYLADFLKRLSADRSFKAVGLKFAKESEGEQGPKSMKGMKGGIEFQIDCELSRG